MQLARSGKNVFQRHIQIAFISAVFDVEIFIKTFFLLSPFKVKMRTKNTLQMHSAILVRKILNSSLLLSFFPCVSAFLRMSLCCFPSWISVNCICSGFTFNDLCYCLMVFLGPIPLCLWPRNSTRPPGPGPESSSAVK